MSDAFELFAFSLAKRLAEVEVDDMAPGEVRSFQTERPLATGDTGYDRERQLYFWDGSAWICLTEN